MKYIYQNTDWHSFRYCGEKISKLLLKIKKAQGFLLGKMDSLGFDVKNNALLQVLTENIIKSSEIEGQILDKHLVRSSIARRLGIDLYVVESNELYSQNYHFANKKMQEMWMKGYKPPFAPKVKK